MHYRPDWIKLLFLCFLFIVSLHVFSLKAYAQCNPGDFLIDEDEFYYYCGKKLLAPAITEIANDLESYLLKGPPPEELLGEQWRYRKEIVEAAASLAKKGSEPGMQYGFGGKLIIQSKGRIKPMCVSKKPGGRNQCDDESRSIDCSGLVAYSDRYAACFTSGFYQAACSKLYILDKSAHGQYTEFVKNDAFIPLDGIPQPGDTVFFKKKVNDSRIEINHAAIYLGKSSDNKIRVLHAVGGNVAEVIFDKVDSNGILGKRIIGYGNISKLYDKLKP
jgi:hypothetical protein